MTRNRAIAWCSAVLMLGAVNVSNVHAQTAAVEGVARTEDGGAPVPFALVRLVPADTTTSPSGTPPRGITTADGRYRFVGVAPGRYRVQLLRIGFRPVLSDPVQVVAGETVQLALRVASQPLMLPPVTVIADACVVDKELQHYPRIQTVWQQARDGAAVRTEIMGRFRYEIRLNEETVERKADGTPVGVVTRQWVSDPKSAVTNAARSRSERLARGYYGQTTKDGLVGFHMPNELDVLHSDFLKEHCLLATTQHRMGEVGLRFQPLRARRNLLDVGGTIWLDSATFLARRIELEYVDADDQRGTVRLNFGDAAVAGGMLRIPVGGEINLRPSRQDPSNRAESTFTITYSGFVEVRPR